MIPRGGEDAALAFYRDALGLTRIPKPSDMPNPEGIWFALADGELHLGVQDASPAETRAHVALVVDDLDALVIAVEALAVSGKDDCARLAGGTARPARQSLLRNASAFRRRPGALDTPSRSAMHRAHLRRTLLGARTKPSDPVAGLRRVHVWDPFGNRLELMGA